MSCRVRIRLKVTGLTLLCPLLRYCLRQVCVATQLRKLRRTRVVYFPLLSLFHLTSLPPLPESKAPCSSQYSLSSPKTHSAATATAMGGSKCINAGDMQAKPGAIRLRSKTGKFSKHPVAQEAQHGVSVVLAKPVALSTASDATKTSASTTHYVDVEQSTQITQTLVHGCLSSVTFLRSIFPQNCFTTRYYHNTSTQWSYQDFALGTCTARDREIAGHDGAGKAIIALKRGVSDRVDRFLGLMVFHALSPNIVTHLLLGSRHL